MADEASPPFRVIIPRARMEELERFADAAAVTGTQIEFVRWLKELDYRLKHEPHEWGESRQFLPILQLEIRFGSVGELTVWFGVNVETRIVYVKRFRMRGKES